MITASQDFITAVGQNGRHFAAKIYKSGSEVTCDIISITSTKGAQDGQSFTAGAVFSSSLEIKCSNLSASLENEDIELKIGILTDRDEDTYDYITYGKYTVIKAKKNMYQTILTCVGFISSKFNVLLPDITGTPTVANVAAAIQTATGITVSFQGVSSGTTNELATGLSGVTARSALSIVAFAVGGFATENHNGGVDIRQFSIPQNKYALSAENCLSPPIVSEDSFTMTGIKVVVQSGVYLLTQDTTVVADKTYYIRSGTGTEEDPYVYEEVESPTGDPHAQGWYEIGDLYYSSGSPIRQTYENKYVSSAVFAKLSLVLVGLEFDPAEIDMSLGDPRLEPWDCLLVTDVDNTTTHTVPCHLIESTFDGGFSSKIYAVGESQSDTAVEGSVTEQVKKTISDLAITQTAADQAKTAAAAAQSSAETAEASAVSAESYALEALGSAEIASDSATAAKKGAADASSYANTALGQLADLESVFKTLEWVQAHGQYDLTEDTVAQDGKWYFEYDGNEYAVVAPVPNPYLQGFYELVNDDYVLSSDTSLVEGKTYYSRSGSGTEEDPYIYTEIDRPKANPALFGLYELTKVDEAITEYISAHLTLVGNSLWLQATEDDAKIQISTDGITLWKLVNNTNTAIAQYKDDVIIGVETDTHIKLEDGELGFYDGENKVAYISGENLYISKSEITSSLRIGSFVWVVRNANRVSLRYSPQQE